MVGSKQSAVFSDVAENFCGKARLGVAEVEKFTKVGGVGVVGKIGWNDG